MKFKYCPDCGSLLEPRDLGDEVAVPWCEKCAKPWFDMFPTCVITLVHNRRNEVLLLHQGYISNRYANLVSGYVTPGESAEQAARREVLEETGLEIDSLELVGTFWFAKKELLMVGFIAEVENDLPVHISSEVDAAEWHDAAEAVSLVHPAGTGSVSNALCSLFLKRLQCEN